MKYEGDLKEGKRHGQGTMTYADGGNYVGEWEDGEKSGSGTEILRDGTVISGIWENDHLKQSKKD